MRDEVRIAKVENGFIVRCMDRVFVFHSQEELLKELSAYFNDSPSSMIRSTLISISEAVGGECCEEV